MKVFEVFHVLITAFSNSSFFIFFSAIFLVRTFGMFSLLWEISSSNMFSFLLVILVFRRPSGIVFLLSMNNFLYSILLSIADSTNLIIFGMSCEIFFLIVFHNSTICVLVLFFMFLLCICVKTIDHFLCVLCCCDPISLALTSYKYLFIFFHNFFSLQFALLEGTRSLFFMVMQNALLPRKPADNFQIRENYNFCCELWIEHQKIKCEKEKENHLCMLMNFIWIHSCVFTPLLCIIPTRYTYIQDINLETSHCCYLPSSIYKKSKKKVNFIGFIEYEMGRGISRHVL